MAGYHLKDIVRGEVGQFSKVKEEYLEFLDAVEQKSHIMSLVELSDLAGSIKHYLLSQGYQEKWPEMIARSDTYHASVADIQSAFALLENSQEIDLLNYRFFFKVLHNYLSNFNLQLKDILIMSDITERVFLNGYRKPRDI